MSNKTRDIFFFMKHCTWKLLESRTALTLALGYSLATTQLRLVISDVIFEVHYVSVIIINTLLNVNKLYSYLFRSYLSYAHDKSQNNFLTSSRIMIVFG